MVNHRQRPIGRAQSPDPPEFRQGVAGFMRVFPRFPPTFPHMIRADSRVPRKTPVPSTGLSGAAIALLKKKRYALRPLFNEESGHDD
jgi:hypothetical protein